MSSFCLTGVQVGQTADLSAESSGNYRDFTVNFVVPSGTTSYLTIA